MANIILRNLYKLATKIYLRFNIILKIPILEERFSVQTAKMISLALCKRYSPNQLNLIESTFVSVLVCNSKPCQYYVLPHMKQ